MTLSGAGAGASGDVEMLTNAQMQAEIVAALAELKELADGVETVKTRLLAMYGRLEAPSPPAGPAPPLLPVAAVLRDLANGIPTDREGFVVRMTVGAKIARDRVEAAIAELIDDGRVVQATTGARTTIRVSTQAWATVVKSPMTLGIERAILAALDAAPGADRADIIDVVPRLHGLGRVMAQFVLIGMENVGRLPTQTFAPVMPSSAAAGRLIVL